MTTDPQDPRSLHLDPQLVFRNLDPTTTPETLSEWLWLSLGLDVAPDFIVMAKQGPTYTMAFVTVTREALASFLMRYSEGLTFNERALFIEPKKSRSQGGRVPRKIIINRPKVLEIK
jgi:hypothetical protein